MTDRFSAIISGVDGIADCSAYLASTVTVDSLLVTKRITHVAVSSSHILIALRVQPRSRTGPSHLPKRQPSRKPRSRRPPDLSSRAL